MSPIAPVEAVPATAPGLASSAAPHDSPSFFDALTAAGLNPPPDSTEQSADSPSSIAGTSSEEDLLAHPTPTNIPNPKNKNAPDVATLHPFLPGSTTAITMLELTPPRSLAANFDISRVDSAILADAVTSPAGGASPNAPLGPSPSLPPIVPAQVCPQLVTPQSDLPITTSPTDVPPTDSQVDAASSDSSAASMPSPLSASIQTPLAPPDFDPSQDLKRPSARGSEEDLAAKCDLGSKPEPIIAQSGRTSSDSAAESGQIIASAIAEPVPPEPKNESVQLRDLPISTAPAAASTENVSPPQELSPSVSAAGAPTLQKRSTVRTVLSEVLFAKAHPQDSEENPPAIALATHAPAPDPAARHSRSPQPVPSLNPRDLAPQAQPPIQTSPANIEQDRGNTPTAQHLPVPPTGSSADSSVGASLDTHDPSHKAGSTDHKTKAADALPFSAAPTLAATEVPSVSAANSQPQSSASAGPQAQGPTQPDTSLHPTSIPESFQTPAPSPVHLAHIVSKAAQSEMRIGLTTPAFGSVELRTVVHANEVAVQIGSERGDLKTLLTTELPAITHTLQQHDLRLHQIRFEQQGFAFSSDTSQQRDAQPRSFAPKNISTSPFEYPPLESVSVPEFELRPSRGLSILA